MKDVTKRYDAYKVGCLGNNILYTYVSFSANMIFEEYWITVEDIAVAKKFNERYSIDLPLLFISQTIAEMVW